MLSKSIKSSFNSVGTQQILYYQFINLATCFGSSTHRQANSQTILKVHAIHVHAVGSQMFTIVWDPTVCTSTDCISNTVCELD